MGASGKKHRIFWDFVKIEGGVPKAAEKNEQWDGSELLDKRLQK